MKVDGNSSVDLPEGKLSVSNIENLMEKSSSIHNYSAVTIYPLIL